jgi:hypothetical protein
MTPRSLPSLALLGLATAAIAGCGSAGASTVAGVGTFPSAAPATATPAPTAAATPALIQCAYRITDAKGRSLIERYEGYGIRWYLTNQSYPQTCDGIRQSLEGGNDTIGATEAPPGAALCSRNGWSVWPSGDPALARQYCTQLTGHK